MIFPSTGSPPHVIGGFHLSSSSKVIPCVIMDFNQGNQYEGSPINQFPFVPDPISVLPPSSLLWSMVMAPFGSAAFLPTWTSP